MTHAHPASAELCQFEAAYCQNQHTAAVNSEQRAPLLLHAMERPAGLHRHAAAGTATRPRMLAPGRSLQLRCLAKTGSGRSKTESGRTKATAGDQKRTVQKPAPPQPSWMDAYIRASPFADLTLVFGKLQVLNGSPFAAKQALPGVADRRSCASNGALTVLCGLTCHR